MQQKLFVGRSTFALPRTPQFLKSQLFSPKRLSRGRDAWKILTKSCAFSSITAGHNFENRLSGLAYSRVSNTSIAAGLGSDAISQSLPLEDRLQQAPITRIYSPEELVEALDLLKDKIVVLQCKSKTCRPCMGFARKYQRLAEAYTDIVFLEIYGDESKTTRKLMMNFGVKATPTFRLYKSSKLEDTVVGVNQDKIERVIRIVAGLKVEEDEENTNFEKELAEKL